MLVSIGNKLELQKNFLMDFLKFFLHIQLSLKAIKYCILIELQLSIS